jgi:HAD superfamily hydrolase (TIGR01509 family)
MKAVIFDMDGVIVDSEPQHERAFAEVVKLIGYSDRLKLRFSDYVGRSEFLLWSEFVELHQPPQSVAELMVLKRGILVEMIRRERPLFKGLPELVGVLAERYSLAVASGSERPVVEAVLELEGLKNFFPVTVTDSDIRRGKPAPDIFLRAAELLGVAAEECWVIEDSVPGVTAGVAAGMRVIAITNTHKASVLGHATHVVGSYSEIEEILLAAPAE